MEDRWESGMSDDTAVLHEGQGQSQGPIAHLGVVLLVGQPMNRQSKKSQCMEALDTLKENTAM